LASLVIGLLLGPPDEYKLAHKITKITPMDSGKGKIELSPVLFLDDKTFIQLEKIIVRNQLDLSFWLASRASAGSNVDRKSFEVALKRQQVRLPQAS
jgi:hypothetical protein